MAQYNWTNDPTKSGTSVNVDVLNEDLMYLKEVTDTLTLGIPNSLNNVQNITWGLLNPQVGDYTLQETDNGAVITVNSISNAYITVPDSLSTGFSCMIVQLGNPVTIIGSGNMNIIEPDNKYSTAKQYASVSLYVLSATQCLLGGYTA